MNNKVTNIGFLLLFSFIGAFFYFYHAEKRSAILYSEDRALFESLEFETIDHEPKWMNLPPAKILTLDPNFESLNKRGNTMHVEAIQWNDFNFEPTHGVYDIWYIDGQGSIGGGGRNRTKTNMINELSGFLAVNNIRDRFNINLVIIDPPLGGAYASKPFSWGFGGRCGDFLARCADRYIMAPMITGNGDSSAFASWTANLGLYRNKTYAFYKAFKKDQRLLHLLSLEDAKSVDHPFMGFFMISNDQGELIHNFSPYGDTKMKPLSYFNASAISVAKVASNLAGLQSEDVIFFDEYPHFDSSGDLAEAKFKLKDIRVETIPATLGNMAAALVRFDQGMKEIMSVIASARKLMAECAASGFQIDENGKAPCVPDGTRLSLNENGEYVLVKP